MPNKWTKEKRAAYQREWRKNNPERSRIQIKKDNQKPASINARREHKWKTRGSKCTIELYNKLFIEQGGCCAICGLHQLDLPKRLSADHNHITGQVRGLLCGTCNRGLGNFQVDSNGVELLLKAKEYMDNVYP